MNVPINIMMKTSEEKDVVLTANGQITSSCFIDICETNVNIKSD